MGYFFVDRILEIQHGGPSGHSSGRGLKSIGQINPFLRPPIALSRSDSSPELELSPCFAGEAVGQLAAWVAMSHLGFFLRPVAGLTAEVIVGRAARPGDLMLLEAEIESLEEDAVHYHGRATAGDELILELRHVVGPMLPMEEFDDPLDVERQFRRLFREGKTEPESPLSVWEPMARSSDLEEDHPIIETILERDENHILTSAPVPPDAPYLVGHFPRKPVLPATLILDGQVLLARLLIGSTRGNPFRVAKLSNLKMRDFVRPESTILLEARIRDTQHDNQSDSQSDSALVDLTARIGERVISTGAVEMVPLKGREV